MERVVLVLGIVSAFLVQSCSHVEKDKAIFKEHLVVAYGPDAFPYCGGWVTTWARVDAGWGVPQINLMVKLSLPEGTSYTLSDANVIAETSGRRGEPVRFQGRERIEVTNGSQNVLRLRFSPTSTDLPKKISVALSNLGNCKDRSIGVTLAQTRYRY